MWEALWKCEDETEEQEGFDAFNRFYIQKGFEAGLQAVIQEPIACDIEIEKQIPKKPFIYGDGYCSWCCPSCNNGYEDGYESDSVKHLYCPSCGQKLDWRREDEES